MQRLMVLALVLITLPALAQVRTGSDGNQNITIGNQPAEKDDPMATYKAIKEVDKKAKEAAGVTQPERKGPRFFQYAEPAKGAEAQMRKDDPRRREFNHRTPYLPKEEDLKTPEEKEMLRKIKAHRRNLENKLGYQAPTPFEVPEDFDPALMNLGELIVFYSLEDFDYREVFKLMSFTVWQGLSTAYYMPVPENGEFKINLGDQLQITEAMEKRIAEYEAKMAAEGPENMELDEEAIRSEMFDLLYKNGRNKLIIDTVNSFTSEAKMDVRQEAKQRYGVDSYNRVVYMHPLNGRQTYGTTEAEIERLARDVNVLFQKRIEELRLQQ